MHPLRPSGGHETVNANCTANALDCLPLCAGDDCSAYAAPPPPFPRASSTTDRHVPVRLLLTVSLLSAFLFLSLALSMLLLYRRRRLLLRRRRRAAAAPLPHDDGFGDGDEEAGGGGGEVHHVWYIRTVGLDEATIASIATAEYRGGLGWGGDCAVCLGEFCDGELVRLLPRCAHPFHAPCIDTWLRAHVNCPLCRSPVVVSSDLPTGLTEAEAEEHQVFDEMSLSESQAEGAEDSEASSDTQSEDTAAAAEENGRPTPKPIRRSASMDSPLFLVVVSEAHDDNVQTNCKLLNAREMRFFSVKEEAAGTSSSSCQAGQFGVGRSMSSGGLGFFFSRNGCSSGTVLPL